MSNHGPYCCEDFCRIMREHILTPALLASMGPPAHRRRICQLGLCRVIARGLIIEWPPQGSHRGPHGQAMQAFLLALSHPGQLVTYVAGLLAGPELPPALLTRPCEP